MKTGLTVIRLKLLKDFIKEFQRQSEGRNEVRWHGRVNHGYQPLLRAVLPKPDACFKSEGEISELSCLCWLKFFLLLFHLQKHKTKSTSYGAGCHQAGSLRFSTAMPPQSCFDINSNLHTFFNQKEKITFIPPGTQLLGLHWAEDTVDMLSPFLSCLLRLRQPENYLHPRDQGWLQTT